MFEHRASDPRSSRRRIRWTRLGPGGPVATARHDVAGVRTLRGRGRPRQLQRPCRPGRRRHPPRPRRAEHHQDLGRPDGQQRLPPGVPRHRRGAADRRRRTSRTGSPTWSAPATAGPSCGTLGHHAPAPRPLAGPRRGGRHVRDPPDRAPAGRPRAADPDRRAGGARRHVRFGEVELEVVHLRGHTPGSIALVYRGRRRHPHLFTGDSLFPGGPGKTNVARRTSRR